MKIRNKDIMLISRVLSPLKLSIEVSSARRRFLRLMRDQIEDFNAETEEIQDRYVTREPNGNRKMIDKLAHFTKENRKKADEEFEMLNEMKVEVDISKNQEDADVCFNLIQNEIEDIKFKTVDGMTDSEYFNLESLQDIIRNNWEQKNNDNI